MMAMGSVPFLEAVTHPAVRTKALYPSKLLARSSNRSCPGVCLPRGLTGGALQLTFHGLQHEEGSVLHC